MNSEWARCARRGSGRGGLLTSHQSPVTSHHPPVALASSARAPLLFATFTAYHACMARAFDPLANARKLRDNGMAEPLATATVEVAQDATSDLVTRDFLRAELSDLRGELYRVLWLFGATIVGINLTALGIATGVIVALV